MPIEKLVTQKIVGDWRSLKRYAEAKGISYQTLRHSLTALMPVSRAIEDQLDKDGYGKYLRKDRQKMLEELNNNQAEAANV